MIYETLQLLCLQRSSYEGVAMELYIHIPFCVRKCNYCDFLSFAGKENCFAKYGEALIRDVRSHGELVLKDTTVTSVFIGGGTPSLMPEGFYETLLSEINKSFIVQQDAEISIECNPGTVTERKLTEYRNAGINRISFGTQSAVDEELRMLGRIHTWKDCVESVALARMAGFDNINLDLMMNLPGQTKETFSKTLKKAIALSPEHISAYSLILEEGTPFYERYAEHPELLPSDEAAAETYETAVQILADAGYLQYEISNFAKPGRECRHNVGYWKREEYLGIGIGAASLIGDCRYRVEADLAKYLDGLSYEPTEELSDKDLRNETIMLGLRMNEGVSTDDLTERFGSVYVRSFSDKMKRYVSQELAYEKDGRYGLTVRGMLVSNMIIADLME